MTAAEMLPSFPFLSNDHRCDDVRAMMCSDHSRRYFSLFSLSKTDAILEEVYAACSSATERGGGGGRGSEGGQKLDAAELNVAIKATRAKLEAIAGEDLKLPEVRESVEDILEKFDENNDGFLDKREFQGFARTYFSRVEWPMWKTAAKGAAKGVGIHVFMQCVVAPIVALCSPLIIAFAHNEMKKITGEHLDTMKNEVAKKFHSINVFGKDEDGDGINDDVERIERKQKWQRRMKKARDAAAPAAVASAAACAGLM